jgi:murein DD-endopeptidase MepM/ murein hydrolase activator NlpD
MTSRAEFRSYAQKRPSSLRKPPPPPVERTRLTLSRPAALGLAGGAALVMLWALGATGIIVFRDDVVAGFVKREASLEYDYEGRIAELKAELSRVQSRQLVDQQALGEKVDGLLRRQSSLESRQSIVQSLGEIATSAGVNLARPAAPETAPSADQVNIPLPPESPRPLPDSDSIGDVKPGKQALAIGAPSHASVLGGLFGRPARGRGEAGASPATLAALTARIDGLEAAQMQALLAIGSRAKGRVEAVRDTLDGLGVDPDRLVQKAANHPLAEGGPFIPLDLAPNASPFEAAAYEVQKELAAADGLNRALPTVPLRRPFPHAQITSGFGARVDPFLGGAALHAGVDFREDVGAPVRATASGRVEEAGWVGGYGNMVEIDHGNGISTRYGHMSQILVTPGETVTIGQVIGRVGSTGRSTGPHLHYETRIGGVAVDPMRFIRAEHDLDAS